MGTFNRRPPHRPWDVLWTSSRWHHENVFQRTFLGCVFQRSKLQRQTASNQRCAFQRWCKQRQTTSKQRCLFHRRVLQRWSISKQRCENDHFQKEQKKIISNWIHWIQSFNCYFIIFFTLPLILWGICKRILAKPQKLRSWKILYCKNLI